MVEITKEMQEKKNDWCAISVKSHELIDRDDSLKSLVERNLDNREAVYCKNWFRPIPDSELP